MRVITVIPDQNPIIRSQLIFTLITTFWLKEVILPNQLLGFVRESYLGLANQIQYQIYLKNGLLTCYKMSSFPRLKKIPDSSFGSTEPFLSDAW